MQTGIYFFKVVDLNAFLNARTFSLIKNNLGL
jgi:hypothetical protein